MRFGHPSSRKLRRWLEGSDDSIDGHVQLCDVCAHRLEELPTSSRASIGPALIMALPVPADLPERLTGTIDARLATRNDLVLVSELFGIPFRAAKLMTRPQGER